MTIQPLHIDSRYKQLLVSIKSKVRGNRIRAALAVNQEVIHLYWFIGKNIIEKQKETDWGNKLIEALSADLRLAFPESRRFSKRNLERMKAFANEYPDLQIVKQSVSQLPKNEQIAPQTMPLIAAQSVPQLPWGHIILLIQRVKDKTIREWHAKQTLENGWSRETLSRNIKINLYQSQALPEKLQGILPSIEEIEAELSK